MSDVLDEIKKALAAHNYEVEYEEPNCVSEYEHKDGTPYYVVRGDDACYGMGLGSCSVDITLPSGKFSMTHDFTNGWDFSADDLPEAERDAIYENTDEIESMVEDQDDVHVFTDIDSDETIIYIYELATGKCCDEVYSAYDHLPDDDEDEYDDDEEDDEEEEDEDGEDDGDEEDDGEGKEEEDGEDQTITADEFLAMYHTDGDKDDEGRNR